MSIRVRAFGLYLRTLGLGLRLIAAGQWREGARVLVAPVGYWRFIPNAFVAREFSRFENPSVLDVGSPKHLSILLAGKTRREVHATDLNDQKIFSRYAPLARSIGRDNYRTEYQDARSLDYPDQSFDLVYSISVIEHIPDDGDSQALAEFQRVLKPGGVLVVEVPYRREAAVINAAYDSKGEPIEGEMFYERHYDAASLAQRLTAEGLDIRERWILGETLPIDPFIAVPRLPRLARLLMVPLEPWAAAVNYWFRPGDGAGRPLAALLVCARRDPATPENIAAG